MTIAISVILALVIVVSLRMWGNINEVANGLRIYMPTRQELRDMLTIMQTIFLGIAVVCTIAQVLLWL